jgi:electron transport complex protein RnfB
MFVTVAGLTVLGIALGGLLSLVARLLRVQSNPLADELEGMLPGLQCGQCGYPGCRGAAEALAKGEATVKLCPPGGTALAIALAEKMHVEVDLTGAEEKKPLIAVIAEEGCIGCTKCIQVCPTDAIVGAAKQMHTVIPNACVGGAKCVVVCPTDCITMVPVPPADVTLKTWHWPKPDSSLKMAA